MSSKMYKAGQTCEASGIYGITGPRGGKAGDERTVVKGEPFPPPPKAGLFYALVRAAKNRSQQLLTATPPPRLPHFNAVVVDLSWT